jgi:serine/threonine protein kinase
MANTKSVTMSTANLLSTLASPADHKRQSTALQRPAVTGNFGERYSLVRRLAVGGMAEIYLARQAAMAGFEKEVVIKCLRPELASDSRLVDMFVDEARIGALLNHPNIVHVYDVDTHDGIPYIAMEYIVGEELNELCRRGLTHGKFLPLPHAVELIRQAAAGLGYFHAKRARIDAELKGSPLEIVHCDISPSNLLVTEDGFLKVIDFGIARSRGQRWRGESFIPGKLSYMSPEQAARQQVDQRSDIFSLGIVLYEITVGKRLFRGSPAEIVARLASGKIEPPTFAKRDFPADLELIVMRVLEHHPGDRFQGAYDLADALEAFLREHQMASGPVPIARYLDELSEAGGGTRRPELLGGAEPVAIDELDFDSSVFSAFQASDAVGGAGLVPEWEDVEQRDTEVAAALGVGLAELQAMRTPVPDVTLDIEPTDRTKHGLAATESIGLLQTVSPNAGDEKNSNLASASNTARGPSWRLVQGMALLCVALVIGIIVMFALR